ncbi:16S rRNA (cytidine(1402)-2'-O)-methyltransferase [Hydrogenimonas sp.]
MLTLLPTPIGNVEDITLRALRVLERAEVVLCEDTRVARKLLGLLWERHGLQNRAHTFISLHSHNETETLASLDPALFEKEVVYMSDAGMPGISDPGAALVRWCRDHGVPYTVLPGPSALVTAYAASGFASTRFLFFGFLPHKGEARREALAEALAQPWPTVLYEAPHRLGKLLDALAEAAPDRRLFLAKELTKRHERYFEGTAPELREAVTGSLEKGEWVVVIDADGDARPQGGFSPEEIEALDLPPRQKAKLLAKATGRPVKECYESVVKKGR